MRWKNILVIFAVIILGLTAASLILLLSYDYNKLKPHIANAAREATGRELTLEGDLKFQIGFSPALVIENIRFQNAPWGSRPDLALIRRFELEVALLPLLARTVQINRFRLIEPDILVEISKEGVSNLTFETGKKPPQPEPKEKPKDERIDLSGFLLRELLIEKGRVTYRDARSAKTFAVALDRFSIAMDADKPLEMKGTGLYNGHPFRLAAKLGSLEALSNRAEDWPLNLKAEIAEAGISLDGRIRDLAGGRGFQLNLEVKSQNPAKLSSLVGAPVPLKGPLEISAQVSDPAPETYRISDLKMKLERSDLQGGMEIRLAGPRPRLSGNFSSRLLDVKSLMPPKPAAKTDAAAVKPSGKPARVFSRDPLPIGFLKSFDAEVKVSAEKILVPNLVLEKMRADARLKDGDLTLKPLQALIGGGTLDGTVNLRSLGNEAALEGAVKIERFDVGLLLKELGLTELFEGRMDLVLDLRGKGGSVAALMAGLSGRTEAVMNKGRVDRRYIELLGAGVSENLLRLLNPLKQQAGDVQLNCFVNFFDIKDGLAKSTALALDTNYLTLVGEGTVNLKTEELNFALNPVTKDALGAGTVAGLGLGDLSRPLRLTGTLAQPSLGTSAAQASLAVGKILGGELGSLAGTFARDREKTDRDFCLAAIERARKGGQEPPPPKDLGTVGKAAEELKGAADQAKDAFRKMLGK